MFRRQLQLGESSAFDFLQVERKPMQIGIDQKAWALNLGVRGRPASPDINAVLQFDMAHIAIVNCFTEITTDSMHQAWGRLR